MGLAILQEIDARLIEASVTPVFAASQAVLDSFYTHLRRELSEAEAVFFAVFVAQPGQAPVPLAEALLCAMQDVGDEAKLTAWTTEVLRHQGMEGLRPAHVNAAQRAFVLAIHETLSGQLTAAEISAWAAGLRRLCQRLATGMDLPAARVM